VAAAVAADPDAALRRAAKPVLLDEWQEVPSVLGALKRSVDQNGAPGQFLLTGSVEADHSPRSWPGTGRVVRTVLHGMTQREITTPLTAPSPLPFLVLGKIDELVGPRVVPDVDGYVTMALRSGFPEPALRLGPTGTTVWIESYLDRVINRDLSGASQAHDPLRLRRYLEALGLSTAGIPADTTLYEVTGINHRTAEAYDQHLERLYLAERLPAWSSNRLSRLTKRPKRYITDAALAMAAARADTADVLLDSDLLGRVLDTFVAAQLRPELPALGSHARLHHLRTEQGRQEIDLLIDLGAGRVAGIEIKAKAAPTAQDARHLVRLRDTLGEDFLGGIVLHTGPHPFPLTRSIWAVPICMLWATVR
ncbi:MAG: uncharacterized protein QG608_3891, partial [Actinomycetota bacterium]|nr:uncharacterized protein [Actinomycetota bacterium]